MALASFHKVCGTEGNAWQKLIQDAHRWKGQEWASSGWVLSPQRLKRIHTQPGVSVHLPVSVAPRMYFPVSGVAVHSINPVRAF